MKKMKKFNDISFYSRKGKSITFMTRSDWARASELIDILEEAEQFVPDELRNMAERFTIMREKKKERRIYERKAMNELSLGGAKPLRKTSNYSAGRGGKKSDNFSMFSF